MTPFDILLVEDDPRDLELTMRTLQRHRIANTIQVARDGAEALELLLGKQAGPPPRLVMLDLKLPKRTGLEVLTAMRQDPRTRGVPVVVLTSTDDQPEIDACYRQGVNSFVRKPVEFAAFSEAVRQIGMYWMLLNKAPTEARATGPGGQP
ncbi:MAG: response regulator [Planctomycetes bacterium]|nr:response regulator [Planctomycetota bacterium]